MGGQLGASDLNWQADAKSQPKSATLILQLTPRTRSPLERAIVDKPDESRGACHDRGPYATTPVGSAKNRHRAALQELFGSRDKMIAYAFADLCRCAANARLFLNRNFPAVKSHRLLPRLSRRPEKFKIWTLLERAVGCAQIFNALGTITIYQGLQAVVVLIFGRRTKESASFSVPDMT